MNEHRYILEPYKGMKTRYHCPSCQHRDKTFSLYIDTETGEHLHPTVGRCNRESNCSYHCTPKQYFQDSGISFEKTCLSKPKAVTRPLKPVSFINVEVFKASLQSHDENNFVKFLIRLFGVEVANEAISRYFIGTSKQWNGATVFWQIDISGKVRTGKIMLYNASTGKRVKEPFSHINWVHSVLELPDYNLRQCLFGEHLLIDKTKPVAIVESEKTAIIASVYLPQFIWLAVGSLTNLNAEKCSILKGRTVTLFPDLNGFEKWRDKATELSHFTHISVSDLLERKATESERKQGLDLVDYLIRFDYKSFSTSEPIEQPLTFQPLFKQHLIKTKVEAIEPTYHFTKHEKPKAESWERDIIELEAYFATVPLSTHAVKLNQCSTITNVPLFIESHFATVKANNGKRAFLPYLHRLQELREKCKSSLII
jgi:Domain of unknown function (DUF6371)